MESIRYETYPWGLDSFQMLRNSKLRIKNLKDYKLEGCPIALQVWFYEYYSGVMVANNIETSRFFIVN